MTGEAAALYKKLAELDDQALALRMEAPVPPSPVDRVAHAAAHPAYCAPPPPPPLWAATADAAARMQRAAGFEGAAGPGGRPRGSELRERALGAVAGAALGDAAASSVQWVYDVGKLQSLVAERPDGLEFYDPPHLVEAGGLDCCRYAEALFSAFGPGFRGDRSTKAFLRRHAAGALPPLTGAEDDQANAITRLPPLVALHAGGSRAELLGAVERMTRTTQNDASAVAYGCAAALVLEGVILGASVTSAVASTIAWLQDEEREQAATVQAPPPPGLAAVPPAKWGEVAARLQQAADLAPLPPAEIVARLGRNCHLPNSLTTPLHVMLHLEWQRQQGRQGAPGAGGSSLQEGAVPGGAPQLPAPPQQATAAATTAEGGADACLPCGLGGGSPCELPATGYEATAAAPAAQDEWPAALDERGFCETVRLAVREGGCCASRATFVGALAGAQAGGARLPASWRAKSRVNAEVAALARRLLQLRDDREGAHGG
eukprot:scaffold11.g3938.t1